MSVQGFMTVRTQVQCRRVGACLPVVADDSAADEASGLLPRRAQLDGPTPFGDNPADLLASAEQLLRRVCVVGAPSRLFGLRALVAELVWDASTGAGA